MDDPRSVDHNTLFGLGYNLDDDYEEVIKEQTRPRSTIGLRVTPSPKMTPRM